MTVPDPVVRWEINSRDPAAQQKFFGTVFGWTTTVIDQESGYGLVLQRRLVTLDWLVR